jgi:uncharacterized protein YoxC
MAASMAQVLRRVNITRSSESISETLNNLANNFKALSGQINKVLFQARVLKPYFTY